jgi:hypothetical protein
MWFEYGFKDHICKTSYTSIPLNELNKLEFYITQGWKGMPWKNALAYWAHS